MSVTESMEDCEYSKEVWTLREIIDKGLPNMVHVCGGFLNNESEEQSFSQGDNLRLHCMREITYVTGRKRGIANNNEDTVEELIPLDYSKKVKIIEIEGKCFKSVADVMAEMPRFVRTKSMVISDDQNEKLSVIPVGVKIEVIENVIDRALKCIFRNKFVFIGTKQTASFELVEDHNNYSIKEVLDRRKLPITVEFLDSPTEFFSSNIEDCVNNYKSFSGVYTIEKTDTSQMVIGHFKPNRAKIHEDRLYERRTVFVLPLDDEILKNIEVREYIYVTPPYGPPLVTNKDDEDNSEYGNVLFYFKKENAETRTQVQDIEAPPDLPPRNKGIEKDKEEQESSVCSEKPIYEAIECSARVTDATKEYTPLDGNNKSAVEVKDESKVKGSWYTRPIQQLQSWYQKFKGQGDTYAGKEMQKKTSLPNLQITDRERFGTIGRVRRLFRSRSTVESASLGRCQARFTPQELATRLREHGFEEYATFVESNALDDWFFLNNTTDKLCEVTQLTKMAVFKIQNVCKGWMPKERSLSETEASDTYVEL